MSYRGRHAAQHLFAVSNHRLPLVPPSPTVKQYVVYVHSGLCAKFSAPITVFPVNSSEEDSCHCVSRHELVVDLHSVSSF